MNIYYRFEYAEDSEDARVVVLTAFFEPRIIDYIRSFFGILKPLPKIREYRVKFIARSALWRDSRTLTPCSEQMCELLESFYLFSLTNPATTLIGRP